MERIVMRKHADEEHEDTPRPFHTYLLIGLVVAVVIAGAYLNRDAITAFVVNTFTPATASTIVVSEPAAPAPLEPDCAGLCGRACWLVESGATEGTFTSAQGKIGTVGCDGKCWSVSDIVDSLRCCRNSDCTKDKLCDSGVCG
jgi:hypothetical protein